MHALAIIFSNILRYLNWELQCYKLQIVNYGTYKNKLVREADSLIWPDFMIWTDVLKQTQGRKEGVRGSQFPGRRITAWGSEKLPKCLKCFLQYSTFAFEKPQVRTRGHQTYFLHHGPSNPVTPLQKRQVNCIFVTLILSPGLPDPVFKNKKDLFLQQQFITKTTLKI